MGLQRDKVILVNERDEWIGTAPKREAHTAGLLHRALSIFITNSRGELLLQQRATGKYHSGGLWSNTCCSHPVPGEPTMAAAHRRLQEELGFDTSLSRVNTVMYKAVVSAGMTEHEYDHLFAGAWDGDVQPEPGEVSAVRWVKRDVLDQWMDREPQVFTPWFPILLREWDAAAVALV